MNKALYGILAAAALATLKNNSGTGSNNSTVDKLRGNIRNLLMQERMDVALATIYSFVDFSNVDQYKELSLFSNLDIPVSYIQQDLLSLVLSSETEIDGFVDRIIEQIFKSFGSEELALQAWSKNYAALKGSYYDYFSEHDYGVAYSLIMYSVYPHNINSEDWYRLFRGSNTDAEKLVRTQEAEGIQERNRINKEFISAWLKSKIEEESEEGLLKQSMSFENIFKVSGKIFHLLATIEPIKNMPIRDYNPSTIYTMIENSEQFSTGIIRDSGIDDFFMLDLVLQALTWIKDRLSNIKNDDGSRKYPETMIGRYGDMWEFWSDPTRVGSETMIFIEMDHYRKNPMTKPVPQFYKKEGTGLLDIMWSSPASSSNFGTPAWATTSWILYYIYNMIEESKTPSTSEWNEGFNVAVNMFPSIKDNPRKPVLSRPRSIASLISQIQKFLNTEVADNIVKIIQEGEADNMEFSTPLKGFLKPSLDSIGDYATSIFSDKQNDIEIYQSKPGKKMDMLNYVAEYLGHCNTVNESSEVFVIYYKDVPYYTIEVNQNGEIVQFKGIGNRVMGSMSPANQVSKQQKRSSLYFSDLNNISVVLPVFKNLGYSFPTGIFNKGSDLMLYTKKEVSNHKRPEGLTNIIKLLTR